ncbi:hypothetical protein HDU98_002035, partial [Podochytrium sp. JEL0797]
MRCVYSPSVLASMVPKDRMFAHQLHENPLPKSPPAKEEVKPCDPKTSTPSNIYSNEFGLKFRRTTTTDTSASKQSFRSIR